MKSTWQDDLQALREERRLLLQNLHILRQRTIKQGQRLSISTYHETEDTQAKLNEVEKAIKLIVEGNTDAALELERTAYKESPYTNLSISPSSHGKTNPPKGKYKSRSQHVAQKKNSRTIIIFIVVIILTASVFFIYRNKSAQNSANVIAIQMDYYHLGDAPIAEFHSIYPEQNPFIARFVINEAIETAKISLTVSHLDPNKDQAPTTLTINGNFICFLNSYVSVESLQPKTIVIPINPDVLIQGTNEIEIEITATTTEYGQINLDDLEFWDLSLHVNE